MGTRTGLVSRIWRGVKQGFHVAQSTERFIGEDHLGNRYYEIKEDTEKGVRGRRLVKGPTDDVMEIPHLPHEWNAWMRRNREDPPTQEELDRNYAMAMHKQLKGRERQQKLEEDARQGAAEGLIHRMKKRDAEADNKFPVYAEYEEFPGDEKQLR